MLVHEEVATGRWRDSLEPSQRDVPAETAIAIVANGSTHAVMMATPADLEDFAIGFALTEGLITATNEIERFEIIEHEKGVEARMWLTEERGRALFKRRRAMAGPSGCGLCGIESLDEALRPTKRVESLLTMSRSEVLYAMAQLRPAQTLNALTHAVHAAALWDADTGSLTLREDVGRHNALDKLVGAAARNDSQTSRSALLLTSRVSIEMVQKAAVLGTGIVVAVSAPTNLAIRIADEAGVTLCAVARADGFEVFTHAHRIVADAG
jgi:FdhD protein